MAPVHPTVADVMTTELVTIAPTETVRAAAELMMEESVKAVIVTAVEPGIITSTDLVGVIAEGLSPASTSVEAVMTPRVETVTPAIPVTEAAAMMETFGVSHLPVCTDDIVGMISATDVTASVG
jgi:Predicted signal-transduction protein containing cAMP-binding and CBS domains